MANNGKPLSMRQRKPCERCGKSILQKGHEGPQYFETKKYCGQKCNSLAREALKRGEVIDASLFKERASNESAKLFLTLMSGA